MKPTPASPEMNETRWFQCCRSPYIPINASCENYIIFGNITKAYVFGANRRVQEPFAFIGDEMVARECVDFQLRIICKNGRFDVEQNIFFKRQPCREPQFVPSAAAPCSQGNAFILLLGLMMALGIVEFR